MGWWVSTCAVLPVAYGVTPALSPVLYEVGVQAVLASHRLPGAEPEPAASSPPSPRKPAFSSAVHTHTHTHYVPPLLQPCNILDSHSLHHYAHCIFWSSQWFTWNNYSNHMTSLNLQTNVNLIDTQPIATAAPDPSQFTGLFVVCEAQKHSDTCSCCWLAVVHKPMRTKIQWGSHTVDIIIISIQCHKKQKNRWMHEHVIAVAVTLVLMLV